MIIVVAAEKGGVGKSTNAITIACRIKLDGADVVLVDTDTSATAIGWSDIRVQNKIEPPNQVTQNLRQPLPAVIDFAEKYDAVVCDLGAGDYAKMRDLALAADLFLVPTRVGQPDLESTVRLYEAVRSLDGRHKRGRVPLVVAMNATPAAWNNTEDAEARAALEAACPGITILKSSLRDRKVWRDAGKVGRSIYEMPKRDAEKAVAEFEDLFIEALQFANVKETA